MIEVHELGKYFGRFAAVKDVSFQVATGEIVGFLGPNGAGKTTTMRILTCFLPPSSGTARVDGFDVFRDSLKVRERLGYLPESAPLYAEMFVEDYLHYIGRLRGIARKARRARIDAIIEQCGLQEVVHKQVFELSKGFRQRTGLAQALVHDPPFLILDEPTAGLDPNQILEIRDLIREISAAKTILLSTHIMQEVQALCSRVLIINQGSIVRAGTPQELMEEATTGEVIFARIHGAPAAQIRQALLSEPFVHEVFERGRPHEGVLECEIIPAKDRVVSLSQRFAPRAGGEGAAREQSRMVSEHLFDLVRAQGWSLSELRVERASLEEVFRLLTLGEDAPTRSERLHAAAH